ncbi:unnamed protein product [Arctogadus glacialis]
MLVGFGVGPGLIAHHALFQTEASEEERRPCALQPGSGCVIDRLRKQNRPLRLQMGFRAKINGENAVVLFRNCGKYIAIWCIFSPGRPELSRRTA